MNTTKEEKEATLELVEKCRVYLNDNFHKFTEANKIKISLAIISKAMPTKLEGALNVTMMPTAVIGDKPLDLNIGEPEIGNNIT
jgi:hypothetical protein